MTYRLLTLPLLLTLAIPAAAQEDPYAACAAMASDAERLACFDTTHAGQVRIVAEETVREEEERRENFGRLGARDQIEGPVVATVVESFTDATGRLVVRLDNGQVWRERNGSTLRNGVASGSTATLAINWIGVYDMRIEGRRGFLRVERIR